MTADAFSQKALDAISGYGKGRNTLGNADAIVDLLGRCVGA